MNGKKGECPYSLHIVSILFSAHFFSFLFSNKTCRFLCYFFPVKKKNDISMSFWVRTQDMWVCIERELFLKHAKLYRMCFLFAQYLFSVKENCWFPLQKLCIVWECVLATTVHSIIPLQQLMPKFGSFRVTRVTVQEIYDDINIDSNASCVTAFPD